MKARIIKQNHVTVVQAGEKNPETCETRILRNATHSITRESDGTPDEGNPFAPFRGTDGVVREIWFVSSNANCVAFAMHIDIEAKNTGWFIPGWISIHKIPKSFDEIRDFMISDIQALGRTVHEVIEGDKIPNRLPEAPKGQYWIKCLCTNPKDIGSMHWMCKDTTSGYWFHKVGWTSPPKIVERVTKTFTAREYILKQCPEAGLYPAMLEAIAASMQTKLDDAIPCETVAEINDDAGYTAYTEKGVSVYKPVFVMLIDE